MKLFGYAERGFINALLYEIAYRDDPGAAQALVGDLFNCIKWPVAAPHGNLFKKCQSIVVEQSFSDFGDADALLLFESESSGAALFWEGTPGEDYTFPRAWNAFI